MYQEEFNHHENSSPSINHKYTVQIDGVVKISVNKVNGLNKFLMQSFPSIYTNMILIKKSIYYLGR